MEIRKILRKEKDKIRNKYNKLDDDNCKNEFDIREHLELVIKLNYQRGYLRGFERALILLADCNINNKEK